MIKCQYTPQVPKLAIYLYFAIALWASIGCGNKELSKKVVGVWKLDIPSVEKNVPQEMRISNFFKDQERRLAKIRFEFKSDGSATIANPTSTTNGTWYLSGNEIEVNVPSTAGKKPEPVPRLIMEADGSRIHMGESGQMGSADLVRADR